MANEDLDIYPAGFGLEPISLKTHQETKEEVSAAVVGLKSLLSETVQEMPVQPAKPEPVAEPKVEPEPVIEPEPVAEPEPVLEPKAESEPVAEPKPVTKPAPVAEIEPEPVKEPDQAPVAGSQSVPKKKTGKPALVALCVVAVLAVLLLIALAVVGRMVPEWVDQFLYSAEELRILNHVIK